MGAVDRAVREEYGRGSSLGSDVEPRVKEGSMSLLSPLRKVVASVLCAFMALPAFAGTVRVPAGTVVYGETDERVTSRIEKDGWDVGDKVRAHAWRDVTVGGAVVIKAGTPLYVRVSDVKKAKVAGVRGKLELEAVTIPAVDGQDVALDGGYDKSGHGRKALSITLAAVVAWPLIFIKGKQAILEPGTIFDATVQSGMEIETASDAPPRIRLASQELHVDVLYDEMDPEGKSKLLPVQIRNCGGPVAGASVVGVNDKSIPALPLVLGAATDADGCASARGTVDLKALAEHFAKGINRFVVKAGEATTEVVLDIEL